MGCAFQPEGFRTITASVTVADSVEAMSFYAQAFDAVELTEWRLTMPDGHIAHAELRIGDSVLMLSDPAPSIGVHAPAVGAPTPMRLHVFFADVDAAYARALAAGATAVRAPQDEFYGHRAAQIADPFGYVWSLAQQIEAVSAAEMQRRFAAMLG
jgi:PhnB protein